MNDIRSCSISSEHIHGLFLRRWTLIFAPLGLLWLPVAVAGAGVPGAAKAQESLPAAISDAERQLEDGRSTLNENTLIVARQSFEWCTHQYVNDSRCFYDLGRTDSYVTQVKERQKDKKGLQQALDSAIRNTERSIVCNEGSADARALLADLYGRKIGYGGMLTGMRYGPKAEAETRRALQLDANNPRIYVVLGRRQLYSPKIFGGDVDKAIESFRKSTTLDPHYDEGFVWLAIAYGKKGDSGAAKAALDEALRLNPQSVIAKEIRSTMK
jgi:tetratricopeptide (TPR) repeat protein